jgi:hypothetical protein
MMRDLLPALLFLLAMLLLCLLADLSPLGAITTP